MGDEPRPLEHLFRALEELGLAGLDTLELLRDRGDFGGTSETVRAALATERDRWSPRAEHDPAAAQVHEFFSLLLDAIARPDEEQAMQPKTEAKRENAPGQTRRAEAAGRRAKSRVDPADERVGYSNQWRS